MSKLKYKAGVKVCNWTIISRVNDRMVNAICDCGNNSIIDIYNIASRKSKGCAKCKSYNNNGKNYHQNPETKLTYGVWLGMRNRCRNPKNNIYKHYGERGIEVCERWNDFELFLKDMGIKPDNMSIERINNNGNYEPNNCKWVTMKEQCANRRGWTKVAEEYNNAKSKNVYELANELGKQLYQVKAYVKRHNLDISFAKPQKSTGKVMLKYINAKSNNIYDLSRELGLGLYAVSKYVIKNNLDISLEKPVACDCICDCRKAKKEGRDKC